MTARPTRDAKLSERQIENTIPVLTVRNLDQSIAFYHDALGFAVEWRAGGICSVARDGCSIVLQESDAAGSATVWIGLVGETLLAALEKSQVKLLQAPTNKPWAYEMKIADPDGNVIWLGAEPRAR